MSTAEAALARFPEQDVGQTSDRSIALFPAIRANRVLSADTWAVRRTIVRARSALISMRLDDASRATAQLRRLLSDRSSSYFFRLACTVRMLEASILAAEDDCSASRSLLMSVAWHNGDTAAASVLRYVDWKLAEREESYASDPVDYLSAPVGGKAVFRILSLCVSAALAFDRLQLTVSGNLATEALQLAQLRYGRHSPLSTLPATLLAQVAYEQGRFEEAEALLRPRLSVIRASGSLECAARASVLLARLALHRGCHRVAVTLLRETEALGRARGWPRLAAIAASEIARIVESQAAISLRASEQPPVSGRAFRVLRGAPTSHAADDSVNFSTFEDALRRACSAASQGPIENAYQLLIPWLRIGAARGLCMTFVDAGRPLLALLERLYHALPSNEPRLSELRPYIATLLKSTIQPGTEESSSSVSYRPLSRRETGVLQMIAHGMSNKRIAQALGITPETVKSHAKSIFVKLATRTRAQAVARAEAIGFL
jgi:LuxR family maltose regulon positive regulatory protein